MTPVIMVAIESTCVAFLLVILTAYIILPRYGSLRKDGFFFCLLSLIVGIVSDMLSWLCECVPSAAWLQYSSNTLCLVASCFINSFFAYYIVGLIREKKLISWRAAHTISIVNMCGVLTIIVAALSGKLFDIIPYPGRPEIRIYESAGFFYDLPNHLSVLSLIVLFVLILRNAEALGKNQIIVFSIYFLLPMIAVALEVVSESFEFSYAVTAVCMSIVYIMLQSNHINELELREKLLNEWSYMDSLTKLPNRRSFERTMEEVLHDDLVCIAFLDLNGLKKVNDEKGHQEGDKYLMNFADLLLKHFTRESVYRISGDEFVVIARGTGNKQFDSLIKSLRDAIDSNHSVASLGTASGPGSDVSKLIKEAEIKMYEDKEKFYRQNPSFRRRRTDVRE